ncbi:glycosyltransferase [Rhodovulum sp. PH10]|uniref:glycosyltransferase n=1 Tax=Rhodovulum sp. PH10 TaxID=1187851 RepID=UPI0012FCF7A3|nr:glycosyltransferase [Rhodovulum sp. PH10]
MRPRRPPDGTARRGVDPCPELDCVRHLLSPAVLAAVARRALDLGVTADRVLVTSGLLTEETYVRALARHLGVPFEPIDWRARSACPLPDEAFLQAAAAGMLRITPAEDGLGRDVPVIAPKNMATRRLAELAGSPAAAHVRLTTGDRLRRYVRREGEAALGREATERLAKTHPRLSAARRRGRRPHPEIAATLGGLLAAAILAPRAVVIGLGAALALVFLAWTGLRLAALLDSDPPRRPAPRVPDRDLPPYTIVVALHHEAKTLPQLVRALDALDYPPEKLQIVLALEEDDAETRAAAAALPLAPPWEILTVPAIGPRTKPKALNAALPFARGAFLAVFDAEDRPEPDQLRKALAAFDRSGPRLACVQARLTIDNTDDGLLPALFTAEYAALFDVFLPALARWRLPLPLGGSSNHFRTSVLHEVGGWDPWNLTEDADLGLRLARFGFTTTMVASTTLEEAPAKLGPWLKQRTRWFQGWIQTWLVHMRAPWRAWHSLGPHGFATLQLVVGGTVLAALVHPVFATALLVKLFLDGLPTMTDTVDTAVVFLFGGTFVVGHLASLLLAFKGLMRRKLLSIAWVLLLMPLHWLLLAIAAWRALIKFFRDPYRWDKTEHGLARTSRTGALPGEPKRQAGGRGGARSGGIVSRLRSGRKKPADEPAISQ